MSDTLEPFRNILTAFMVQEHSGWRFPLGDIKGADVWYDEPGKLHRLLCSVRGAQHAPRFWSSARAEGVYTFTAGRCAACDWGFTQFGSSMEAIVDKYPRDMACPFCSDGRDEATAAWASERKEANLMCRAHYKQCAVGVYDPECVRGEAMPDYRRLDEK